VNAGQVVALSGGIGGAKLALVLYRENLTRQSFAICRSSV
jgi:hypothetical protein